MFARFVVVEVLQVLPDGPCVQEAALALERKHLVPRALDGARLVNVDVPALDAKDPLTRSEERLDDRRVRLGPTHEEMNLGVRDAHLNSPDSLVLPVPLYANKTMHFFSSNNLLKYSAISLIELNSLYPILFKIKSIFVSWLLCGI